MQSYRPHRNRPQVVSASQQQHCLRPGTHWLPEHPPPPQVLQPPEPAAPYRPSRPPPLPQPVQLACVTVPTVSASLIVATALTIAAGDGGGACSLAPGG